MASSSSQDGELCEIVGFLSHSTRKLPDATKSAFHGSWGRRWRNVDANCAPAAFAVVMEVAYDRLGLLPLDESPLGQLFTARIACDENTQAAAMSVFHQFCLRLTDGDRSAPFPGESSPDNPHIACSSLFQNFGALIGTSGPAYDAGKEHLSGYVAPFARLSFRPGDVMADAMGVYLDKRPGHMPKLIQVDVGRLKSDDQALVVAPVNVAVTGRSHVQYRCCGALYGNGTHWICTVTCSQECVWEYDSASDGALRQVHEEPFAWPRKCKMKQGYGPGIFVYVLKEGKVKGFDTPGGGVRSGGVDPERSNRASHPAGKRKHDADDGSSTPAPLVPRQTLKAGTMTPEQRVENLEFLRTCTGTEGYRYVDNPGNAAGLDDLRQKAHFLASQVLFHLDQTAHGVHQPGPPGKPSMYYFKFDGHDPGGKNTARITPAAQDPACHVAHNAILKFAMRGELQRYLETGKAYICHTGFLLENIDTKIIRDKGKRDPEGYKRQLLHSDGSVCKERCDTDADRLFEDSRGATKYTWRSPSLLKRRNGAVGACHVDSWNQVDEAAVVVIVTLTEHGGVYSCCLAILSYLIRTT